MTNPVWTAAQINRFTLQAEEHFCQDYHILIERVALDIVTNTNLYTIPDDVMDIRRITYRGIKVFPLSHRSDRLLFEGLTSSGEPRWYIFNKLGRNTIRLFPTPIETIVANQSDLFEVARISTQCIVEYYILPDGIGIQIPSYMRRRLLKAYVLSQCFAIEGKGQNIKAAQYWANKWKYMSEAYGAQAYDLIQSARKIMNPAIETFNRQPPVATLSISRFGIGLEPGE